VAISDAIDPLGPPSRRPVPGLKFYNPEIHTAAFALPHFMKKSLVVRLGSFLNE